MMQLLKLMLSKKARLEISNYSIVFRVFIKKGNRKISFFYNIFSKIYSSSKSVSSFSSPNFKETNIPTKSESAMNPKEAHSGRCI